MIAARAAAHRLTTGRTARTLALGLATVATAAAALPAAPASADPVLTGVDLSTYVRVGRWDLPEPTRTTPPAGSLLAQEASGVAYDPVTEGLYIVGDGGTSVVHVDKTGNLVDSMTLASGSSPQGTAFYDTEGITYVGNGKFVFTEERDRQVDEFTYVPNTTLHRADVQTVKLGTTIDNIGLEGVSNDPQTGGFILVKEKDPQGIFQTDIDFAAHTATNGSDSTDESTNLFEPALAGLDDFSDVFALSNLTSLTGSDTSHLLVLSQESGKIENIDRLGNVSSSLTLVQDSDTTLSIPDQTHEGVTMDDDGNLYVVSEEGGGDINHPQLWVFSPSTGTNLAPTGVTLTHQVTSIPDNTSTTSRVKVADVTVADDGLGTNNLSVTGADAAHFEVDSSGLYLKAGTTLNHTTTPSYSVSVAVDDPDVGTTTPDATSSPFTLAVTAPAAAPSVIVSEVSPWSSGNATYGADWFELTNTGTTAVDLTGWKMDDNSHSSGNAVALNGVDSLAPGQSAIFLEGDATKDAAFLTSWFGSDVPAGFAAGYYGGAGVGLSTDGDEVNIYDGVGGLVTGVAFGGSSSGRTFDNSAGLGSTTLPRPIITQLSTAGIDGAFTTPDGQTGSPGAVQWPLTISEVAPWGNNEASYAADWFEVTNNGTRAVDLTGWKMDDSTDDFADAVTLNGVGSLAPGQSAVFLEGDATKDAAFTTAWFGADVPAGFAAGYYSGDGVGLSTNSDGVNLFDPVGHHVTGVSFAGSTTDFSFDNSAGINGTITALSVAGAHGAFTTANGQTGSPGRTTAFPLIVSEVAPWGSSNDTYGADWFEVTNPGSAAVDISGWKMDDNSNAIGTAVALNGITSIAPGQSVIFIEGDATKAAAFTSAWFGTDVPAGFAIGYYSGAGVSLSTTTDGVNLFDASGAHDTGVSFGASIDGVSFDNAAGSNGTLTTLSALGVNGAVTVGGETGSPGTIAPDTTAPVITFTGNAGTYTTDAQVSIACAAADEPHGSGIATTNCADITGTGASFGVGTHDVTMTATDHAGNVGTATVTFTVTAPVDDTPSGDGGGGPIVPISAPGPAIVPTQVVTPPFVPTPAATKPKPKAKVTVAKSTKAATLAKGYTTTLSGLKAKSKVTLTVRFGSKLLKTVTATADKAGKAHIKVKLTKAQLAGLHGKKLALRFAVTGANGKKSTITASLKVS
jgi:uncharacterized protein YjiK